MLFARAAAYLVTEATAWQRLPRALPPLRLFATALGSWWERGEQPQGRHVPLGAPCFGKPENARWADVPGFDVLPLALGLGGQNVEPGTHGERAGPRLLRLSKQAAARAGPGGSEMLRPAFAMIPRVRRDAGRRGARALRRTRRPMLHRIVFIPVLSAAPATGRGTTTTAPGGRG